jgi:hypothetical protein
VTITDSIAPIHWGEVLLSTVVGDPDRAEGRAGERTAVHAAHAAA